MLALGAAAGLALPGVAPRVRAELAYDLPRRGNVHLLHMTDAHAQLQPLYYREPSVNIGVHQARNRIPHLVGQALLKEVGLPPGTERAHALTYLDYEASAREFGQVGGFAHLATLVKRLKPIALAHCCLTVVIFGRGPPQPCGPRGRTWWRRPSSWAST